MSSFISLLDVSDPDFEKDESKVYLQHEEIAVEAPSMLFLNSGKLKKIWSSDHISVVEHTCPREEILTIIYTIKSNRVLNYEYFLPFLKLSNYLEVNESYLQQFMPFHYLTLRNAVRNCYLVYSMFTMDRYRSLCKSICKSQLGFDLYGVHKKSYSRFKRIFRSLCWNSVH